MQEILNRILEMDENARKKIDDVRKQQKNTKAEVLQLKNQVFNNYLEKAKAKVSETNEKKLKTAEKDFQKTLEQKEKIISELDLLFNKNKDKWVENIYNNVLKVD